MLSIYLFIIQQQEELGQCSGNCNKILSSYHHHFHYTSSLSFISSSLDLSPFPSYIIIHLHHFRYILSVSIIIYHHCEPWNGSPPPPPQLSSSIVLKMFQNTGLLNTCFDSSGTFKRGPSHLSPPPRRPTQALPRVLPGPPLYPEGSQPFKSPAQGANPDPS